MPSSVHILLLAAVTPLASLVAQGYSTGWETFTASAVGTPCAGQDGFYVPAVAGSIDGNIHTYAGNTLGLTQNLLGGANFWGGLSQGGTAFAKIGRASCRERVEICVGAGAVQ